MLPNHGCAGALLTDLYQLTMAYGYWKAGKADQEAVFELFFRKPPFQCGFTIAAGLAPAIDFLGAFCFTDDDTAFLGTLRGNDNQPLFEGKFLDYLKALRFTCDVQAIPEGTVVFPQKLLLRIQGPIAHLSGQVDVVGLHERYGLRLSCDLLACITEFRGKRCGMGDALQQKAL